VPYPAHVGVPRERREDKKVAGSATNALECNLTPRNASKSDESRGINRGIHVPRRSGRERRGGRAASVKENDSLPLGREVERQSSDIFVWPRLVGRWPLTQTTLEERWIGATKLCRPRDSEPFLRQAALQVSPSTRPLPAVITRQQGKHPVRVFTYDGNPVKQVSTLAGYKALKRAGIERRFAFTICATPGPRGTCRTGRRYMFFRSLGAG
jgi:hypothetical protein